MSAASSQALSMSQQVYTTVSRVEPSPASAAAIASSISPQPLGLSLAHPDQTQLRQGDQLENDFVRGSRDLHCPKW
jgi:hypothetical protein